MKELSAKEAKEIANELNKHSDRIGMVGAVLVKESPVRVETNKGTLYLNDDFVTAAKAGKLTNSVVETALRTFKELEFGYQKL